MNPLACIAALSVAVASSASTDKMKEADVPKPVREAFSGRFPRARVKAIKKEAKKRGGQDCYEVESKDGGVNRDVIITADGKVLEVEESLQLKSLPGPVVAAVKRKFPGGTLKSAEKVMRGDETLYEVAVKQGGASKLCRE